MEQIHDDAGQVPRLVCGMFFWVYHRSMVHTLLNIEKLNIIWGYIMFHIENLRSNRDLLPWVPESQYEVPQGKDHLPHASEGMRQVLQTSIKYTVSPKVT